MSHLVCFHFFSLLLANIQIISHLLLYVFFFLLLLLVYSQEYNDTIICNCNLYFILVLFFVCFFFSPAVCVYVCFILIMYMHYIRINSSIRHSMVLVSKLFSHIFVKFRDPIYLCRFNDPFALVILCFHVLKNDCICFYQLIFDIEIFGMWNELYSCINVSFYLCLCLYLCVFFSLIPFRK